MVTFVASRQACISNFYLLMYGRDVLNGDKIVINMEFVIKLFEVIKICSQ
jgi:hypothetical protein